MPSKFLGSLELITDSPVEVAAWVADKCGMPVVAGGYQAIGLARRGRLVAGFVFHNMQQNRGSMEMTAAGCGAFLNRSVIQFLCWNGFESLKVKHCMARTSAKNVRAQRALESAGFVLEGRQRKAWDGVEDALLYGITRDDAQEWLAMEMED